MELGTVYPLHLYFTLPRDVNFQVSDGVYLSNYEQFPSILFTIWIPRPPSQQVTLLCSDTTVKFKKTTALTKKQKTKFLLLTKTAPPFLCFLFVCFIFLAYWILSRRFRTPPPPPLEISFGFVPDRYKAKLSFLQWACVVRELWRLYLTFYTINLKRNIFKRRLGTKKRNEHQFNFKSHFASNENSLRVEGRNIWLIVV